MPETSASDAHYVIDLRAEFIDPRKRIWRLFSGRRYRFIEEFVDKKLEFLDMPGLILPNEPVTRLTDHLKERVILARTVREWATKFASWERAGGQGDPPQEPSRDIHDYVKGHRAFSNDLGAAISFFGEARKGDLVVVPDHIASRRVLIGEFMEAPETRVNVTVERYGSEQIPARPVRWFPAVDERSLPPQLSENLRKPNPFTLLGSQFYEDLYSGSYGTYYGNGVFAARFNTDSEHFSGSDNFDLGLLIKLSSKICWDIEEGRSAHQYRDLGIVFDESMPALFRPSVSCNVNSPGLFDLKAGSLVPLFAVALFALASAAHAGEMPHPDRIKIVNSSHPEDSACLPQINDSVRDALDMMGYNVWKPACDRLTRLREEPKLRSSARIQVKK